MKTTDKNERLIAMTELLLGAFRAVFGIDMKSELTNEGSIFIDGWIDVCLLDDGHWAVSILRSVRGSNCWEPPYVDDIEVGTFKENEVVFKVVSLIADHKLEEYMLYRFERDNT